MSWGTKCQDSQISWCHPLLGDGYVIKRSYDMSQIMKVGPFSLNWPIDLFSLIVMMPARLYVCLCACAFLLTLMKKIDIHSTFSEGTRGRGTYSQSQGSGLRGRSPWRCIRWVVQPRGRGKNCPFRGSWVRGSVKFTFVQDKRQRPMMAREIRGSAKRQRQTVAIQKGVE